MAAIDDALLDEEELRGARFVALALLRDAKAEHARLHETPDPEALHDFRVAVRRLRSWLRAQKDALAGSVPKSALGGLRRVARATNESRDAEVFAGWLTALRPTLPPRQRPGATWLLTQVGVRKRNADERAMQSLSERFTGAAETLEERLPVYRQTHHLDDGIRSTRFAVVLAAQLRTHAISLARRLERVRNASDDAEAHRGRIAGKRLRYLLEPVAPNISGGGEAVDQLKTLQDTLGDLHDAHVWLGSLRDHLERWSADEARRLVQVARVEDPGADVAAPPKSNRLHSGVLAIAGALRERARERFETFQREWGSERVLVFLGAIDAIARELEGRVPANIEIERKYLLRSLPEQMPVADVVLIEQGYLPGERLIERLRREVSDGGERWTRTVKMGAGVVRTELEESTTRETFEAMWPLTSGRRVIKRRHRIAEGALTWEIDEFTDRDLVLAEVELKDPSQQPDLPAWLTAAVVREVTGEPEYVNANLARLRGHVDG